MQDYKLPTPAKGVPHPIPEGLDGIARMFRASKTNEERCLLTLTGYAGLRLNEARKVKAPDIDFGRQLMRVFGKGDKLRMVPITSLMIPHLIGRIPEVDYGWPLITMSDSGARRAVTRLAERAGLSRHVSSHDMRATFATAAYDNSLDLRAVQELLGHASSQTTEIYTGVTNETLHRVADFSRKDS